MPSIVSLKIDLMSRNYYYKLSGVTYFLNYLNRSKSVNRKFHLLMLSFLVGVARHGQSTQNKFASSLRYLKKELKS